MTDTTAQSYVDQYAPPQAGAQPQSGTANQPFGIQNQGPTPAVQTTTPTPSPVGSFTPDQTNQPPAPEVAPPAAPEPSAPVAQPAAPAQPADTSAAKSQLLEDQNIFTLLGVNQADDAEKEAFLDELQQVIWEDFLANDVDLLVTEEEKKELNTVMELKYANDLEQQEAVVVYLEKLIPDLEEIMLEKALELKGEMVKERLAGMREFFANNAEKLTALTEAEKLIASEQWHDVAESLNRLSAAA